MLNLFHRKISMKEDFVPQNPKSYLHPHMLYFVIVLQTYFPLFWLHIHWMFLPLPAIPCHCQMYPEIGGALPAPSRSTKFFVKKIFFIFLKLYNEFKKAIFQLSIIGFRFRGFYCNFPFGEFYTHSLRADRVKVNILACCLFNVYLF